MLREACPCPRLPAGPREATDNLLITVTRRSIDGYPGWDFSPVVISLERAIQSDERPATMVSWRFPRFSITHDRNETHGYRCC